MKTFLSFATLLAVAATTATAAEIQCGFITPDGTTFDLSDQQGHVLAVSDSRNEGYESEFTYQVGICTDIVNVPAECKPPLNSEDKCKNGCSAIQYLDCETQHDCTCNRISGTLAMSNATKWSLLHPDDPSLGVSLSYFNGEVCNIKQSDGSTKSIPRSVKLDFICAERDYVPSSVEVSEDSTCEYHMSFPTSYGCPTSCPMGRISTDGGALVKRKVCSGKGVCRYDNSQNAAQCFCDQGWHGDDCSLQGTKKTDTVAGSSGGAVVGALFGGCALGVLIGGAVYYYFVVYRKHQSADSGQENYAEAPEAAAWQGTSTTYQPPENDEEQQQQQQHRDEPLLS